MVPKPPPPQAPPVVVSPQPANAGPPPPPEAEPAPDTTRPTAHVAMPKPPPPETPALPALVEVGGLESPSEHEPAATALPQGRPYPCEDCLDLMEQEADIKELLREMDRQERRFLEENWYCWPSEASSRGEPCDFEQCLWDAADLIQKLREHGFEEIVQHIGSFFAGLAMRDVSIPQPLQRERSPDRLGR